MSEEDEEHVCARHGNYKPTPGGNCPDCLKGDAKIKKKCFICDGDTSYGISISSDVMRLHPDYKEDNHNPYDCYQDDYKEPEWAHLECYLEWVINKILKEKIK